MSTVHLDLGPEGKGRLWGSLSSQLREGRRKDGVIERGGYAGMRSKVRSSRRAKGARADAVRAVEDDDVWASDVGYVVV